MDNDPKIYRDAKGRVTLVDYKSNALRVAEIDQAELMVRIMEAISEQRRPKGCSAEECLDGAFVAGSPSTMATLQRVSLVAIEYFAEVLTKGEPLQ